MTTDNEIYKQYRDNFKVSSIKEPLPKHIVLPYLKNVQQAIINNNTQLEYQSRYNIHLLECDIPLSIGNISMEQKSINHEEELKQYNKTKEKFDGRIRNLKIHFASNILHECFEKAKLNNEIPHEMHMEEFLQKYMT